MQLGRFQVSTLRPPPILSIDFSVDGRFFGVAVEDGYEVWRTWPLRLVRRRSECWAFAPDNDAASGVPAAHDQNSPGRSREHCHWPTRHSSHCRAGAIRRSTRQTRWWCITMLQGRLSPSLNLGEL